MSKKKLVPYIDLIVRQPTVHKRASKHVHSPSPSASSSFTPRKKRNFEDDNLSEDFAYMFTEIRDNHSRQLSPTASEFGITNHEPTTSSSSHSLLQAGSSKSLTEPFVYTHDDDVDVVMEDEYTVIQGETPLDDDEREAGDLPVRLLDDFVIYDVESLEAVPLAILMELQYSPRKFSASGVVKPWIERDSDDDDDDDDDSETEACKSKIQLQPVWERFILNLIVEFSIHSPGNRKGELDEKIYIKTEFAWYILGAPSRQYRTFVRPFWIKHRLLHLLVSAANENTRLTFEEFKDGIQEFDEAEENINSSKSIIGRGLTEQDVESPDVQAYLGSTLQELHAQKTIQIIRVPAIRDILGPLRYEFDTDISSESSWQAEPRHSVKGVSKLSQKLKPSEKTFLTPVVNRIAKNLFTGSLEVATSGLYEDHDVASKKHRDYKAHATNPNKIVWGKRLVEGQDIYGSVTVDGVTYQIGDIVMVEPEGNEKTLRESQTTNKYGNRWWFCQIRYFFQEVKKGCISKMFHGQWFVHGCKTILQETSHSKALYLLKKSCDSNLISSIFKKCNLTIMKHGDIETPDDGSRDANDFHCALMYDDDVTSFEDILPEALSVEEAWQYKSCYSCKLKKREDRDMEVKVGGEDEITVHGETYHVHDHVYIHPTGAGQVLDICQIVQVNGSGKSITATVRHFGRYDEYVRKQREGQSSGQELVFDERRLFFSHSIQVIPAHKLEGRCQVRHLTNEVEIEEWVAHDNHFYLNQVGGVDVLQPMKKRDLGYCRECRDEDRGICVQTERFLKLNSKLIGMELFSGAGGLGIGMNFSNFVETKYAVEYEPSAAKTYKRNHPETFVYCQDSSKLLKHAVSVSNNEKPPPLLSNDGTTYCPPMPKKNDQVDFIFGGPPCQSFSKANHSKRPDDIRSTLPCNMLSYVEHYEPSYFLLENVAGFLEHKIQSTHTTPSGVVSCEIQFGMVKLVTRTLIALGYQVRYRLLQSGQYGVPQSRRRVIFWGAKRGLALPEFPIPVHAFPAVLPRVTLPTGGKLDPITRSKDPADYHFFAPLKAITVDDALSDLPPFEWKNPHILIPARASDQAESRRRQNVLKIPQFNANVLEGEKEFENLPGFPRGVPYAKMPQNRYQQWLRQGVLKDGGSVDEDGDVDMENDGEAGMVMAHYTGRWKNKIIEATANVPLQALADHRDLDDIFLPPRARRKLANNQLVLYGRLDRDAHFKCAVTTLSPVVKNQWPLHPWLKRVISVREAARAQGFPDNYVFESVNTGAGRIVTDQLRQIGNAVSVPFALALGKELGKAVMKDWETKEREGSVAL